MADMYGRVQQDGAGRVQDGSSAQWRMLRGGEGVVVPWVQALILEGLGFSAQFGAANLEDTDPGTFGAGGIDLTEIDMLVTLPSSGALGLIPIYFKPVFEAIGTIAAVDVLLAHGTAAVIGANSITPTLTNMKPGHANTTGCTIAALGDAGGTGLTITGYIYREGGTHLTGVAATGQTLMPEWSIGRAGHAPVVSGASRQVAAYLASQAGTGYIHYEQIEMASAYL
jgi:hypothetical protein